VFILFLQKADGSLGDSVAAFHYSAHGFADSITDLLSLQKNTKVAEKVRRRRLARLLAVDGLVEQCRQRGKTTVGSNPNGS
jgi:hypothetical protein